jgi:hypothetical protein
MDLEVEEEVQVNSIYIEWNNERKLPKSWGRDYHSSTEAFSTPNIRDQEKPYQDILQLKH